MAGEHVISEEVMELALAACEKGKNYMAYNSLSYFLDKDSVQFFYTGQEALDFAFENSTGKEAYLTVRVQSTLDLLHEFQYGHRLESIINQSKNRYMNQQNLDYLKENLKYMGFGDKLYADLEKNVQQQFPEFTLKMHAEFSKQTMDAILFFKKSEQGDMYFFNRYDAILKNDVGTFEQSFYLNKGQGITLKEGFNLLQGRAVYKEMAPKEGENYHAWLQLDFSEKQNGSYKVKQFHENYGFDLKETLKHFPIKELKTEEQTERLLASLQRGNKQSVTMMAAGREQMFFLQAAPQYKTLTIYDVGATRPLTHDQKMALMVKDFPSQRTKINGEVTQPAGPQSGREIKNSSLSKDANEEGESKKEAAKKNKGRGITEKSVEQKTSKSKSAKNLLPQKEQNPPKKGIRV